MTRTNIEFRTEDGVTLRGWWYPAGASSAEKKPTIIMAHGYSAVKEMYLENFAEVFSAQGGFHVLVYDNRCLGESDGEPRQEIDPWLQIRDYRDAITFVSGRDDVDKTKIGIWGSSYSGAHVIVVAAIDRRVKCVVSQVPLVAGLENARRLVRADLWAGFREMFDADRVNRLKGGQPAMIAVASKNPAEPSALPTADSAEFFFRETETRWPNWRNECTLRSVEMFTEYEPGAYIANIGARPSHRR
ncbi:alpha/beta-hydrolase [Gonapodya prolifera JEL478]|uniref:Alpha/beta-hydrolase n=1 Tax=Gonapodya prolifera (strain JEL478) TaxID=1344416 RepID=A0A139AXI8_GONPJ|nr:alpha/beta-hydrolase [Gonapodya prolifera JEL478]|eukprot:KXS21462.1 alpha/beta-hydrolase [Gonapodya prolifera JEL478]